MTAIRALNSLGQLIQIGSFLDRLKVDAPQRSFLSSINAGLAFSWTSVDPSALAGSFNLYLQNDSTLGLILDWMIVGNVEAALWKLHKVTGTAAAGNALDGVNLNQSSTNITTDRATARGDDAITGLTSSGIILPTRVIATDSKEVSLAQYGIKIGQNQAIAVEYDTGTTGIAEACIIGHFE